MNKSRRKWRRAALLVSVALLVWVAMDLFWPRRSDLRDSDPQEVARLETDMCARTTSGMKSGSFCRSWQDLQTQVNR
jgi:hypothetical protein